MNKRTNENLVSAKKAIVDALGNRAKKARFMTEVGVSIQRLGIGKEEMEDALTALEAEGLVVVRDNFCADPHLAEVDLRVAALVDNPNDAAAQVAALHEIDLAWNKWLGEYLANHRCG